MPAVWRITRLPSSTEYLGIAPLPHPINSSDGCDNGRIQSQKVHPSIASSPCVSNAWLTTGSIQNTRVASIRLRPAFSRSLERGSVTLHIRVVQSWPDPHPCNRKTSILASFLNRVAAFCLPFVDSTRMHGTPLVSKACSIILNV